MTVDLPDTWHFRDDFFDVVVYPNERRITAKSRTSEYAFEHRWGKDVNLLAVLALTTSERCRFQEEISGS